MSSPQGLGLDVQEVPKTLTHGVPNPARVLHCTGTGAAWGTQGLLLSQNFCFSKAILTRNGNGLEVGIAVCGDLSEAGGMGSDTLSLLLQKGNVKAGC